MATPRTRGQLDALFFILWNLFPAFTNGFSPRPPPATIPMVALQLALNHLVTPLGIWTPTRSAVLSTTIACTPLARTNLPPSLGLASILHTYAPVGIADRGRVFPLRTSPSGP